MGTVYIRYLQRQLRLLSHLSHESMMLARVSDRGSNEATQASNQLLLRFIHVFVTLRNDKVIANVTEDDLNLYEQQLMWLSILKA